MREPHAAPKTKIRQLFLMLEQKTLQVLFDLIYNEIRDILTIEHSATID